MYRTSSGMSQGGLFHRPRDRYVTDGSVNHIHIERQRERETYLI